MKKKILMPLLIIIVLAGSIASCKKNLIEKPFSSLAPVTIFTDETGLKQATLGVYQSWTSTFFTLNNRYGNIFDVLYRFTLSETGHQYATAGVYGTAFMDPYTSFAETPQTTAGAVVWQRLYFTISAANAVIANAGKAVSADKADVYIAEAKVNRANAYFFLVRSFGDVPLIKNEISSLSQSEEIFAPRSPALDVYNFIVEDLKFAEQKLPNTWTSADAGRVTAGSAKSLLGKVYLTMAGKPLSKKENVQLAIDKLKEVVNAEATYNYGLLDDFTAIFSTSNKHSKEIVLSFGHFYSSSHIDDNLNPFFVGLDGIDPSGGQCSFGMTYKFYKLFENNDKRRDFTAVERYRYLTNGDSLIYDPATFHYINKRTGLPSFNTNIKYGVGFGKYSRDARPAGSLPWSYSDDLIELRYADVLLIYAEALNEAGLTNEALIPLNRVRVRAGTTAYTVISQDDLRQKIRQERRLELIGEGTTVFDIRRWGTLQTEIAAMSPDQIINGALPPYSAKLELYPIPQVEIDANPKLIQNTGW